MNTLINTTEVNNLHWAMRLVRKHMNSDTTYAKLCKKGGGETQPVYIVSVYLKSDSSK